MLDIGGLIDPHTGTMPRAVGVEGGADLELELVPNAWSALAEIGGVHYVSADADQLAVTGGIQYSPSARVVLSLVALVGLASGSDRFGILFGVSPKLRLW